MRAPHQDGRGTYMTVSESLRVLVFSEQYPPDRGGVAISARRITSGLRAAGVDVAVVCYDSEAAPTDLPHVRSLAQSDGLCVHRVGPYFKEHAGQTGEDEKASMRRNAFHLITRLAERFRPSLIHSIYLLDAGFLASLVARHLGVPHLTSVRGTDLSRGLFHAGRFALLRHTVESADGITFVNEYLSQLARAAFRMPRFARVVPNGVSVDAIRNDRDTARSAIRTAYAVPHGQPLIGFVGWARAKKGVEDLLDAVAAAKHTAPYLLILGDFPEEGDRTAFSGRARRLGLSDRFAVTGPLEHDRVHELLPGLDAVVIPSWDDGMPNALLEAMERGVPVFGSDILADVLDNGRDGFVFERHNVAQLAELLDIFLAQPEVLSAVGRAARQTAVERFDHRYERDAYLSLYQSLLQTGSAS
ncbi:MAG TPA: glycosyltransferase [Gemmatimonadales bacterium]|nr:glycosyltransferase [Gemmatimonadales bacterium]